METNTLIACHDCERVQKIPEVPVRGSVRCLRCGALLYKHKGDCVDPTLALTLAGIVLFILINIFPFISFRMGGKMEETTLITGIQVFFAQGWWHVGLLVLFVAFIAPAIQLLGLFYILLPLRYGWIVPGLPRILRTLQATAPWSMIEIFMLGILVTIVKLTKDGELTYGISLYAFMAFTFVLAAIINTFDPHQIWKKRDEVRNISTKCHFNAGGVISCRTCHLLCSGLDLSAQPKCPRCGAPLSRRKTLSISRTWALVLTAIIFYIPANLFPITNIISFGDEKTDTILSGVLYFAEEGLWHLALIIFTASIMVPLVKLVILSFLLISVQRKSTWRQKDRTRLYRVTEAIGRWSMVDIFAITVLIALVNLGQIATVKVEDAAIYFAAVVVITMFAAMTFDPRLIWDTENNSHE
ncbi:MAG: paraquat-inducible protein A [Desulfobacterales bacterium]|nr:paraquat-inducible protein A [Desulfobacterales bacterium]